MALESSVETCENDARLVLPRTLPSAHRVKLPYVKLFSSLEFQFYPAHLPRPMYYNTPNSLPSPPQCRNPNAPASCTSQKSTSTEKTSPPASTPMSNPPPVNTRKSSSSPSPI